MPSSPFLPHWQNLSWKIMLSFFCLQYFKNRNSLKKTKILTNLLNCEIVFFWRDIAFRQRKVLNHLSKFSLSWILLFETFQFECFFNSNLFSWIYWLAHSWNPEIECLKSAQSCQKLSYELRHCSIFIGPIIALPCQSLSSQTKPSWKFHILLNLFLSTKVVQ